MKVKKLFWVGLFAGVVGTIVYIRSNTLAYQKNLRNQLKIEKLRMTHAALKHALWLRKEPVFPYRPLILRFNKSTPEEKLRFFYLPPSFVASQYRLLQDVHTAMELYGVSYFIESGTVLGAMRHGGIIPWDDDMDIAMMDTEVKRFESHVIPHLKKMGYDIDFSDGDSDQPYTRFDQGVWHGYKVSNGVCHLDISVFEKKPNGKVRYITNVYPDYFFYETELFPLKRYTFGPLVVWGPNNPVPYLNRGYKDWQTKAVFDGCQAFPIDRIVANWSLMKDISTPSSVPSDTACATPQQPKGTRS
jgi:lipopolysaccharide cholinephosphotransferase